MAVQKIDPKYRVKTRKELDLMKWDSMSAAGIANSLLKATDAAMNHIHAARVDVGLRIAAKEKEIRDKWQVAKVQDMHYLAHDVHELRKEQAQYERLLKKAEDARGFIVARMNEMKVTA